MLRMLHSMQGFFVSPKMRVADWLLGIASILWGVYSVALTGTKTGWLYVFAGLVGCACAYFRVGERLQAALRKSLVRTR